MSDGRIESARESAAADGAEPGGVTGRNEYRYNTVNRRTDNDAPAGEIGSSRGHADWFIEHNVEQLDDDDDNRR